MQQILKILEEYNYPIKSGLDYTNEFTFLIAIILSAQAKDTFINSQTTKLFSQYNTPEKILSLNEGIFEYIKKIGLWRNKGTNILKLAQQIIDLKNIENKEEWYQQIKTNKINQFDDYTLFGPIISQEGIPSFRAALLNLNGIGRKTANVFLNVIYKAPVFPVDTHVIRLTNRLKIADSKNPLTIEKILINTVPEPYRNKICHYLIWHGRNICKAINPKCSECKLNKLCKSLHDIRLSRT